MRARVSACVADMPTPTLTEAEIRCADGSLHTYIAEHVASWRMGQVGYSHIVLKLGTHGIYG